MIWWRSRAESVTGMAQTLEAAGEGLAVLMRTSEAEIGSLAGGFKEIAGQTTSLLGLASRIADCVEQDRVKAVLPSVRTLGSAAIDFVEARLIATHGILQMVATEIALLSQISAVTKSQSLIALKTRVLTMMTNVEVGRLGVAGTGFQYLATELAKFSLALTGDTEELIRLADARRSAVKATRRVLAAELPHLADEFARIHVDLGDDLAALESGLTTLSAMPAQFNQSVRQIETQITGVVAAIQSYDITRQQIEHVQEALGEMSLNCRGAGESSLKQQRKRSQIYAGLTVQIYQLQHIRATVAGWTSQIRICMEAILNVTASELIDLGPKVLQQEREIAAQLAHIELLEGESRGYGERIRQTVGEHSSLVKLIEQQVGKAAVVRQMLHLLSLNSVIEASRLGPQANVILEVGNGITELSAEWSGITDRFELSRQNIVQMVERMVPLMATFGKAGDERMQQAQTHTVAGLHSLRAAAAFAGTQTQAIQSCLAKIQEMRTGISRTGDVLDASYVRIDPILASLQGVQQKLLASHPEVESGFDSSEMKRILSASYTTEVEREVLHAALDGAALPAVQQVLAGNCVELF